MLYPAIAQELIERRKHDLEVRDRLLVAGRLFRGYDPEMEEVHLDNARWLQKIIGAIGWPAQEQVGEDASQAAWLIVQHAISFPAFMKRSLAVLEEQIKTRTIDPANVAFLSDRIALYENRPQLYGTQFVDNEEGRLVVYQLEGCVADVNRRRQQVGLNTVGERLAELIAQTKGEREKRPLVNDSQSRQEEYDVWRRKVGWIDSRRPAV